MTMKSLLGLAACLILGIRAFVLYPGRSTVRSVSVPSRSARPIFQHRPISRLASSSTEPSEKPEAKPLTLRQTAELLDRTFVQACMQLAEGYVDVLKLFIVATRSAYLQNIEPLELIRAVQDLPPPGFANRPLMPEEIRLRNTWIQVVYLVLSAVDEKPPMNVDANILDIYGKIVPIVRRRRSLSSEYSGKDLLKATSQFFDLTDPFEEAVAVQSLRVMWVTLTVLEEVERCEGEFAKMDAPTPPIPGAFS